MRRASRARRTPLISFDAALRCAHRRVRLFDKRGMTRCAVAEPRHRGTSKGAARTGGPPNRHETPAGAAVAGRGGGIVRRCNGCRAREAAFPPPGARCPSPPRLATAAPARPTGQPSPGRRSRNLYVRDRHPMGTTAGPSSGRSPGVVLGLTPPPRNRMHPRPTAPRRPLHPWVPVSPRLSGTPERTRAASPALSLLQGVSVGSAQGLLRTSGKQWGVFAPGRTPQP